MPDLPYRLFRFLGPMETRTCKGWDVIPLEKPVRQVELFLANREVDGKVTPAVFARLSHGIAERDPSELVAIPDPKLDIFDDAGLDAAIETLTADGSATFWCGRRNGKPGKPVLSLHRLWIVDRFEPGVGDGETFFSRMPLFQPGPGSSLTFGNGTDASWALDLTLPHSQLPDAGPPPPARIIYNSHVPGSEVRRRRSESDQERLARWIGWIQRPTFLALAGKELDDLKHARPFLDEIAFSTHPVSSVIEVSGRDLPLKTLHKLVSSAKREPVRRHFEIRAERIGIENDVSNFRTVETCAIKGPLDLAEHLGGVLEPSNFEVSLLRETTISDVLLREALKENRDAPVGRTEFRVLLRWTTSIDLADQFPPPAVLDFSAGGLPEALRIAELTRDALPSVARQPQSALPEFAGRIDAGFVAYVGGVYRVDAASLSRPPAPYASLRPLPSVRITLDTVTGDEMFDGWRTLPQSAPQTTKLKLPGLLDPALAGWSATVTLLRRPKLLKDASKEVAEFDPSGTPLGTPAPRFGLVGIDIHFDQEFRPVTFRLGSLAFRTGDRLLSKDTPSSLTIQRRDRRALGPTSDRAPTLHVIFELRLPIAHVEPVTIDVAHGDRDIRSDDLLIRESVGTAHADAAFELRLEERLSDDQDRHLTATLSNRTTSSDEGSSGDGSGGDALGGDSSNDDDPGKALEQAQSRESASYVVLSRFPFSAYRFTRPAFADVGDEDGNEIAEYDSDQRTWRLKSKPSALYRFVRQASGIGEGADKPGRYEILDDAGDGPVPMPPDPDHPEQTYAVPMRHSPPTVLWTRPSDLARNFYLPEYAGRALFRQRGDFGLGMELAALRTELVYGLSTGLRVERRAVDGLPARVAEIEALSGRLLTARVDEPGLNWPDFRSDLTDRPEQLEVWTLDPDRSDPFRPARFSDGLSFALRSTAHFAHPVSSPLVEPSGADTEVGFDPLRFDAQYGLPGGALWPIEQANVVRILAETVGASGGTLESVSLSPLGDSGDQSAQFLGDYVSIITETHEGRLSRHRVEVRGRIGVCWHRAKHVVIYERTTAASAQFAPANQPGRSQRPILRKVAEFVEILEPVRSYPDSAAAEEKTAGPLRQIRFNATRIAVDSAWGRDIGRVGWKVPLWNRAAAKRRPQVYPFPDISFVTAGEGDGPDPVAVQDCLDPDNLYFYTDPEAARSLSSDTDAWPPRRSIDYTPLGSVVNLRKLTDIGSVNENEMGKRQAPASRIVPGLRAFTWRLAPSASRSRVNAGRGAKPIFAGLESVTFMRAPPHEDQADLKEVIEERKVEAGDLPVPDPLRPYPFNNSALAKPLALYGKVHDARRRLKREIDKGGDIEGAKEELRSALKDLSTATDDVLLAEIKSAVGEDVMSKADQALREFKKLKAKPIVGDVLKFDERACTRLADELTASLKRRRLLLTRIAGEARVTVGDWVEGIGYVPNEDDLRNKLTNHFKGALDTALDTAQAGIGDLRGEVGTARAILADWHRDAQSSLDRALARVDDLAVRFGDLQPVSDERLRRALQQLSDAVEGLEDEALQVLDEARHRFATDLSAQASVLGSRLVTATAQVIKAKETAQFTFAGLDKSVVRIGAGARGVIDGLPTSADLRQYKARMDTEWPKPDDVPPAAQPLYDLVAAAADRETGIDHIGRDAAAQIDGISRSAQVVLADANAMARQIAAEAKQKLAKVQALADELTAAIEGAADALDDELRKGLEKVSGATRQVVGDVVVLANDVLRDLRPHHAVLDNAVRQIRDWIAARALRLSLAEKEAHAAADIWLGRIERELAVIEERLPKIVTERFNSAVVEPVIAALVGSIDWSLAASDGVALKSEIQSKLDALESDFAARLDQAQDLAGDAVAEAQKLCKTLAGYKDLLLASAEEALREIASELKDEATALLKEFDQTGLPDLVDGVGSMVRIVDKGIDTIHESGELVRSVIDRGVELISEFKEASPGALPGLGLKLVSFASTAPEVAALKAKADQMRMLVDDAKDVLESKPVRMGLDLLGDAAKALGLKFDTSTFADAIGIDAIKTDGKALLRDLVPDFCGMDLSGLLGDVGLDGDVPDWLKVTHDLDVKAGRAWILATLDAPVPGRKALFALGPFVMYVRNSTLKAWLRAEANKDEAETEVTDYAEFLTTIEAVVGGQTMVTLEAVRMTYSSREKLNVEFDPKRIRIHRNMQFIQDTFGKIFGDSLGGLTVLKDGGLPVGVEHRFAMPPLSLNYATSGVQNIAISNAFSLRALPDFVIANRFNLSTIDVPFIFSIFIIGGTGYIQIDAEYRPVGDRMLVTVEFGVGGSAALAFALGPIAGGVFITLVVTIRYARRMGYQGADLNSGLTTSLALGIAGCVSIFGLATILLGLQLCISYHESGRMDGRGSVCVELRISRFFKLKFKGQATYKLRDGRSETKVTSETEAEITDPKVKKALDKFEKLDQARRSL
ncbi:hypothetical protein [Acuticoccus sp. I52.16.1]|uniref:hypothetical protein n=1 Tax=Acuticoccus sp. I52.16.1 TaxID=2928472 RepID=UPI001FD39C1C|nr:hypothetical protein [Acuticoccus sp. I52.16.1]UOM36747.1 hypothetical protein MRB58_11395 [Acuticoccus sp. I52.16.1]